ncbi:MAG: hypothetical protein JHC95_17830 [Solirubrobacteraceae bacterium]|nr:hypothetical protein [Solirubrobacteraceae bacterium]
MLAIPAYAAAAKLPTYYRYGSKCTKIGCSLAAYTNSKNTRMVAFSLGPKCSAAGSNFSASNNGVLFKINSKGKFKTTITSNSYDKTDAQGTAGVVTIEGKVTKQDKVKGTWSVDKTSVGCANVKTGSYTMKYKGKQQGG